MSKSFDEYYVLLQRELKLQGKSESTAESYQRSLRRVNERIPKDLDQLNVEDLKFYFADLLDTHSWSTVKVDRCALVFFYTYVLNRKWDWVKIVRIPQVKKLPNILSQEEVVRVLSQVEKLRYQVCLSCIYSMGLRLSEGLRIETGDIYKATMRVQIRNTKGKRDRLVPLPHVTYHLLAKYWRTHRNEKLLFPNVKGTLERVRKAKVPMDKGAMQGALKLALRDSHISRNISVHSLRHSYATHLVEMGINLRVIQEILGHSSPLTTAVYTQLSKPVQEKSNELINELMSKLGGLL